MRRDWVMHYATVTEAALIVERSRSDVWERVSSGALATVRIGSHDLIPVFLLRAVERRLNEHDG